MKEKRCGLSPEDRERINRAISFWNEYGVHQESGAATWEVIDEVQRKVTECLYAAEIEAHAIESLTAKAMMLMQGWTET